MKILVSNKFLEFHKDKCEAHNKKVSILPDYKEKECNGCYKKFFSYIRHKTNLCCLCSKKRRALKRGRAVILQDGYPYKEYLNVHELQDYYKDGEIICLLCGNYFKALSSHLMAIHDIDTDAYKLKYGLFLTKGLLSADTRNKQIKNSKEKSKYLDWRLGATLALESIKKNGMRKSAISQMRHMQKINLTPASKKFFESLKGKKTDAVCVKCGALIKNIAVFSAIVSRCTITCKSCRLKSRKESMNKYWNKKAPGEKKEYMKRKAKEYRMKNHD